MTLTPQVLTDCRIYVEGADLTGFGNKVELSATAADIDRTVFGDQGWTGRVAGVWDSSISLDGLWQAGDLSMPDDMWWQQLGQGTPVTVVPTSGAVGSLAYLTKALPGSYKAGGQHGKLLEWSASLKGSSPLVRGQVMHPQGAARTSSGVGTAYQLGALAAAQRLWVNLHVMSVAGTTPSITVRVESSVDNTWSAPTTRFTFAADTVLDGQAGSVLGAVTDTWWRAAWSITGTTPSILFAVAAGIGPR